MSVLKRKDFRKRYNAIFSPLQSWQDGGIMRVSYYSVFNYDEYDKNEEKYGISITFPDIPEANTCARNYAEGVDMALEVLQLCLIDSEIESYPTPSSIDNIMLCKYEKAVLIQYDTDKIDISKFKFFNE